jgi:glutamine amidotransferase-like uncharacterized protein
MQGEIAIYNGPGAYVYDIKKALKLLKVPFDVIDKKGIKEKLNNYKTLIMPGGDTERYVSSLSKGDFYERIKNFVFGGGKYIGICAGAYLAPKECIGLKKGRRIKLKGLSIINVKSIREHKRRRPGKLRKIKFRKHPLVRGYSQELEIWYHNGPGFIPGKEIEVAAVYENGLAAIVSSKYGKGKVILFGPHPEGDFKKKINPAKLGTLYLIKNSIDY